MSNKHIGSNFDDFLAEEGILADTQAEAIKRVFSWQLRQYLVENKMTKVDFAEKLDTSRAALDRLLDETNTSVTLQSLVKAAEVMNKKLKISISG